MNRCPAICLNAQISSRSTNQIKSRPPLTFKRSWPRRQSAVIPAAAIATCNNLAGLPVERANAPQIRFRFFISNSKMRTCVFLT
jgi:hypothetical protein